MRAVFIGLSCLLSAACASLAGAEQGPKTYHVYFMGGQSNMDGFGYNSDLPDALLAGDDTIPIYHGKTVVDGEDGGGVGLWTFIRPGHGIGFDTDGVSNQYSDRFGPELSFAMRIQQIRADEHAAILKFSRGGTGLIDGVSGYGSWDPEYRSGNARNQYDNALTAIQTAISARDIDGDGYDDVLIPAGILWMQGEADAHSNVSAAVNYRANLSRLMDLLRAALRADDLPVVIGRIQDSGDTPETQVMAYADIVQAAQASFATGDACADIVTISEDFTFLPDGWHYVSADYIALGEAFAEKMNGLRSQCG